MNQEERSYQSAIGLVSNLATRYQISAIQPLLESCRQAASRSHLNVAVLGRFKAGKSSALNDVIGRAVLPVGVVPVTSVITEVTYGTVETLIIRFNDGREIRAGVGELTSFVSEAENSNNRKGVLKATLQIPEMSRWVGLCFIDTPGLESAFAHNTEASLAWTPNVDIALVAIAVDPPLTEQDIHLIAKLMKYTPRIAILLTKVDILLESEQREVIDFIRIQLSRKFEQDIPIYPYSTRAGYEQLRRNFENCFLTRVAGELGTQRRAVLNRKITTLLGECQNYVRLALKSSELLDSERAALQERALAEKEALADTKLNIELVARNAAARTRNSIEQVLAPHEAPIRRELTAALDRESSSFPKKFADILVFFEQWLNAALSSKLLSLSAEKQNEFVRPLVNAQRQYQRLLQTFRDRLSERTMVLYGVRLRTTEPEITLQPPKVPDVKIGRVFDHNWELLSPLLPMPLLGRAVLRRLSRKVADETFKNLSRLSAQWAECITSAISQLQLEAETRIEDLLATIERLTGSSQRDINQIVEDMGQLSEVMRSFPVEYL